MNKVLREIFGYETDWELPISQAHNKYDVRRIPDEIYEIQEDTKILEIQDDTYEKDIMNFIYNHTDWRYAKAYETYSEFLLSKPPIEFKGKAMGSGFNYGSTNIILDCPKQLLILAEND